MGKVNARIKVQNWTDVELVSLGHRTEPARSADLDALVDTGTVFLYLQSSVIKGLGLRAVSEVTSRTLSDRIERRRVFSPVDLEIQGRSARFDVVELPDSLPNVVGQIPLEALDWVVDLRRQRLVPNPEHTHGELSDEF